VDAGADAELFFPPDLASRAGRGPVEAGIESQDRHQEVRSRYCARCPVVDDCMKDALTNNIEWLIGTWGGELFGLVDQKAARLVKKEMES
jgi:hypothetical protein